MGMFLQFGIIISSVIRLYSAKTDIQEDCRVIPVPSLPISLNGKYLEGFSFGKVLEMNKNFCLIKCLQQRRCQSVNYDSDSSKCHFNNETHNTQPSALILSTDNKQYYPLDGFDESVLGRCEGHTCTGNTICQPLPPGSNDMFQCINVDSVIDVPDCILEDGCINCMPSMFTISLLNYRPIGCFNAGGAANPMPILLSNMRSGIDWTNLQLIVDSCAVLANTSGYKYFGIEYYGECWVASTFDSTSFTMVDRSKCDTKCSYGVGAEHKQMVYELL